MSLPSLAFKIYKTIFMPTEVKKESKFNENEGNQREVSVINNIGPDLYNELKEAYFGGHTDMYIPAGPIATTNGTNKSEDKAIVVQDNPSIYHYDVNSLFPSVMQDNKYPTKLFAKFIGDIRYFDRFSNLWEDMLSICRVRVTAPYNISNPLLPFRDVKSGRVIYPDGTWTGMYTSVEIKNAEKYGYEFEILSGYIFSSEDLFSNYVNSIYKMKESSSKGTAMYTISKLLLNSLYGRFGLNPKLDKYMITSKKDMENKLAKDLPFLEERIDFGNLSMCSFHGKSINSSNVAIAIFVTAYARTYMSQFFNVKGLSLYYTDTDSLFFDKPLPTHLCDDKKLGLLKLESVYTNFIATNAKSWLGVDSYGNSICKMKGSKNKLTYLDFLSLLQLNSTFKIYHDKWYRDFKNSTINIKDTPFSFKSNDNKRELIYNNNVMIDTKNKTVINKLDMY